LTTCKRLFHFAAAKILASRCNTAICGIERYVLQYRNWILKKIRSKD